MLCLLNHFVLVEASSDDDNLEIVNNIKLFFIVTSVTLVTYLILMRIHIAIVTSKVERLSRFGIQSSVNSRPLSISLLEADSTSQLFDLTLTKQLRRINVPIKLSEILARYDYPSDSKIYKNLVIACDVANEARRVTRKGSNTHPETNEKTASEKRSLLIDIAKIRIHIYFMHLLAIFSHPVRSFTDAQNVFIEELAKLSMYYGVGNCQEMSLIAWYFLRKRDKSIPVDVYCLEEGDHEFLMIGEHDNAVICDPWSGDVYPYTKEEICRRLLCYRQITTANNESVNIVTSFHPDSDSVERDSSFAKVPLTLFSGLCYFGLSFFAAPYFYQSLAELPQLVKEKIVTTGYR